jgi:PKD repeat protein
MIGTTLPNEVVLITAHLDDVPSSGPAPGADDNASGSAAVMMAAEILSRRQFQRTVCFVFFTGEEQAVLGSTAYAAAAYSSGQNIVGVLNLDMISWDKAGGPVVGLHTRSTGNPGYAADKSIADLFTNVVASYGLSDKITPLLISDGWAYSDHAAFWNKGYPAIVAMEDENNDFNPYYHSSNDLPTTLNFVYFTNFMKAAVGTVAHLCSSSDSGIPQAIARIKATPTTGAAPFAVAFDGSASSGSTGTIVSYDWNFGDGATGSGATVNHTYTAAGAYTASLTVTDTAGATDVAIVTIAANSSDLRARTASLSVDSAGMLKIFASVINDGTVSTGTGFKNAHYLSADAVLDPGVDRLIYENSRTTALEAGQTWSYTASLSIAGVEPGSYYLILSTDSAKAIAEGNEANNVLASAPVALRPDLFFSTLEFSSTGTAVTSSLTLKNLGPARQALPVTVGVYISTDTTITKSDILCGTYTTPAGTIFEPGVTLKQTVTFPVPLGTPAGYYYMGAIADPANAIAEWNKSNNTASARNRVRLKR